MFSINVKGQVLDFEKVKTKATVYSFRVRSLNQFGF